MNSLNPFSKNAYFPDQKSYLAVSSNWGTLLPFLCEKHFSRFISTFEPQDFCRLAQVSRIFRATIDAIWIKDENNSLGNRMWAARIILNNANPFEGMFSALKSMFGTIFAEMDEHTLETIKELLLRTGAEAYVENFSFLELKTFMFFYLSPIGKQIFIKTPAVMTEIHIRSQSALQQIVEEWIKEKRAKEETPKSMLIENCEAEQLSTGTNFAAISERPTAAVVSIETPNHKAKLSLEEAKIALNIAQRKLAKAQRKLAKAYDKLEKASDLMINDQATPPLVIHMGNITLEDVPMLETGEIMDDPLNTAALKEKLKELE